MSPSQPLSPAQMSPNLPRVTMAFPPLAPPQSPQKAPGHLPHHVGVHHHVDPSPEDPQKQANSLEHHPAHPHHNRAVPATWFNYETLWNESVLPAFREKIDFSTIQLKETEPPPNFVQQARVEYFAAQEKWLEQLQQVSNLSGGGPLSPKKSPTSSSSSGFQQNQPTTSGPLIKSTPERKAYTEKINFQDQISRLRKIDSTVSSFPFPLPLLFPLLQLFLAPSPMSCVLITPTLPPARYNSCRGPAPCPVFFFPPGASQLCNKADTNEVAPKI